MSLQSQLEAFRAEFLTRRPPHIVEAMQRATADLAPNQHLCHQRPFRVRPGL